MLSRTEVSTFRKPSSSFHFSLSLTVVAAALLMQGTAHAGTPALVQNAAQAAFARQANTQIVATSSAGVTSTTAAKTDASEADVDAKLETSADGTVKAWVPIAKDYETGYVSGTQVVRYGAGNKWIKKTVTGTFGCSQSAFGGNPAPAWARVCEVKTTVPAPLPMPANAPTAGPSIDTQKTWYGFIGYNDTRVTETSELPAPGGVNSGAIRMVCDPSHMGFDDPLVYPGQPGKSHLHTFFGNTAVDAYSTAASIATSGASTCRGGVADRSAYWVPTMIDTKTDRPLRPLAIMVYYKNHGLGDPKSIQEIPVGLRMIAGKSSNATADGPFTYRCIGGSTNGKSSKSIPGCEKGTYLRAQLDFPECWDGKNLDSPDHMSHMTYRFGSTCPASHPVPIPKLSYLVDYPAITGDIDKRWRLSSDMYDKNLPGGYSAHGDFVNGWEPEVMRTFVNDCNRARADCHAHLLGNYKRMY